MTFFNRLENTEVLIRQRGGYTTAPVFERNKVIYAKIGSNYHHLSVNGSVQGSNMTWEEFGGNLKDRIIAKGLTMALAPEIVIPEANPFKTSTSAAALLAA